MLISKLFDFLATQNKLEKETQFKRSTRGFD